MWQPKHVHAEDQREAVHVLADTHLTLPPALRVRLDLQSDEHDEAEASGGRPSTDEGKREDPGQAGEIRVGEREEREGDDLRPEKSNTCREERVRTAED